jgi:hypothetical protein
VQALTLLVIMRSMPVDTIRMIRTDMINQELDDQCMEVLKTYAVRETAVKARKDPENTGWLERINSMPGLDDGELTSAHGTLIAEGLLRFEVTGRCLGLQYQLSTLGRAILSRNAQAADDPECDSSESETAAA